MLVKGSSWSSFFLNVRSVSVSELIVDEAKEIGSKDVVPVVTFEPCRPSSVNLFEEHEDAGAWLRYFWVIDGLLHEDERFLYPFSNVQRDFICCVVKEQLE